MEEQTCGLHFSPVLDASSLEHQTPSRATALQPRPQGKTMSQKKKKGGDLIGKRKRWALSHAEGEGGSLAGFPVPW